jgi:hypothetical protein
MQDAAILEPAGCRPHLTTRPTIIREAPQHGGQLYLPLLLLLLLLLYLSFHPQICLYCRTTPNKHKAKGGIFTDLACRHLIEQLVRQLCPRHTDTHALLLLLLVVVVAP